MGIGPAAGPGQNPMQRRGNQGTRRRLKDWLCPGGLRREGLYFALTRSERLRPKVRLVGARLSLTGREIEGGPPWRAIRILGVALMNRSNRIDHIRLTSH